MAERDEAGWFYAPSRPLGPLTTDEIIRHAHAGVVKPTGYVWSQDTGEWVRFSEVADTLGPPTIYMPKDLPSPPIYEPAPVERPMPTPATGTAAVRCWWILGISLLVTVGSGLALLVDFPEWGGLIALPGLVAGAWAFRSEVAGTRVNPRQLSFAKAPFKRFQFLRFGRRTVATDQLSHATVAPRLLGLERVMIEGKFGKAALLFDTKARRNAFVFAIQARNSSFKFYRM